MFVITGNILKRPVLSQKFSYDMSVNENRPKYMGDSGAEVNTSCADNTKTL